MMAEGKKGGSNSMTDRQRERRKNKRTSIGHSKNSRPNKKGYNVNPLTKPCNL